MKRTRVGVTNLTVMAVLLTAGVAEAQIQLGDVAKTVHKAASGEVEKEINTRLTEEAKKNQCSFKKDSDRLAPGCDQKLKNLANSLVDAKKKLDAAGVHNFKFEVTGHTDSAGKA